MKPSTDSPAPFVCVVVPAYNAEKYLRQTLESVAKQTLRELECVVVDDGARDGTAQLAMEFAAHDARFRLVSQANAGVAVARNTGWANASESARFVAFLDADDLWEPEMLQTLTELLEAHPGAAGAHCTAFYIDGDGERINEGVLEDSGIRRYFFDGRGIGRSVAADPTTFATAISNSPIITPGCVLIRRAALEKIGGFNPDFSTAADWEMWVRLARLSDLPFIAKPLLAYRRHDSNMSAGRKKAIAEGRALRRAMIEAPTNTPQQRDLAERVYRAFYWHMARLRFPSAWRELGERRVKKAAHTLMLALVNTAMAAKGRP